MVFKKAKLNYVNAAFVAILTLSASMIYGQGKYFSRNGQIRFLSDAKIEQIEAKNNKVSSALDVSTGKIEFIVLIRSFQFEKALMQEHFNENYMESAKYPKATFSGNITNLSNIQFDKDGTYKATVSGKLTMHGVTKDITANGTIKVNKGSIEVQSVLKVLLSDYNIKIPAVVKDQIAKEVEITILTTMNKVK